MFLWDGYKILLGILVDNFNLSYHENHAKHFLVDVPLTKCTEVPIKISRMKGYHFFWCVPLLRVQGSKNYQMLFVSIILNSLNFNHFLRPVFCFLPFVSSTIITHLCSWSIITSAIFTFCIFLYLEMLNKRLLHYKSRTTSLVNRYKDLDGYGWLHANQS